MKFRKWAFVPTTVGAFCITATSLLAQAGEIPARDGRYYYGHDMMWSGGQWGSFGMVLGPIIMILVLVGIIAGIIYLLRLFGAVGPAGNGHAGQDRAMTLLKERYAKDEIDSAEFAERKKLLEQ